ncbi:glutathione S-transferase kappa 1-like isoform X5 [Sinocyclocheilus rhinocerous]|uniref:glutathione S-transferase kappa 1-like isoform X5 n=1 Tax=Sinocyclocheilus rhinocerous TaxID=307959 RepID=UPI0007B957B7|nr:PREDICTED: glutathione S-transferase kappa 1-like isoform X5 [Sinocyclocheilus rhinocerous]
MSNSRRVVELFYDVISPYSWLAFEVLCCYRNVWNIDLKFKPAFLGGVIYGSDSLNAMRFVTAVAEKGKEGDTLERVSRELWTRKWRTHQDITQPASLTDAGLKAGLSANEVEEILTLSISQPIKDKLKSVTEEALEYKERSGWGLTLTSLQPRCDHYSSILCLSEQLLNTILKYCKFTFFIQQQTHTHTHKIKKS